MREGEGTEVKKNPTVEEHLADQTVSMAERDFIEVMRAMSTAGVSYDFMQRIVTIAQKHAGQGSHAPEPEPEPEPESTPKPAMRTRGKAKA